LREVKIELKKVSTLSRKETFASTLVVLITIFVISVFLGIVDIGLSKAVGLLLR
jgi:preprotein translocase subunit SecE